MFILFRLNPDVVLCFVSVLRLQHSCSLSSTFICTSCHVIFVFTASWLSNFSCIAYYTSQQTVLKRDFKL